MKCPPYPRLSSECKRDVETVCLETVGIFHEGWEGDDDSPDRSGRYGHNVARGVGTISKERLEPPLDRLRPWIEDVSWILP